MTDEYGRIHTDGSRSGGQPVLKPCPFCGGQAEIAEIETEDLPLWLGECQEPPCEAVAPDLIIQRFSEERLAFLQALPTFATFGKGWTRRVAEVETQAQNLA
jgi:hypothetical protein